MSKILALVAQRLLAEFGCLWRKLVAKYGSFSTIAKGSQYCQTE